MPKTELQTYPADMAWAIVRAHRHTFAIATRELREMVIMPEVFEVPDTPSFIRGVINLRGRSLPLIDLRKRIGEHSLADEQRALAAMLEERERDHHNWLNELEASLREKRPFGLATDPHKCQFGKWYDTYKAQNALVALHLKKFDAPHREIHAVALEVKVLEASGEHQKAQQLLAVTRSGTLGRLSVLFAELRTLIGATDREIALVVEYARNLFAVAADSVMSVEKLAPDSIQNLESGAQVPPNGVVQRFGKRAKTGEVTMILELDRLRDSAAMAGTGV